MRIVTFEVSTPAGRFQRLGALDGEGSRTRIVDLHAAFARHLSERGDEPTPREYATLRVPPDMVGWLRAGRQGLEGARHAVDFATGNPTVCGLAEETLVYRRADVRLLSPLPRPTAFRDFSTYEEHMTRAEGFGYEKSEAWYSTPPYYKGSCTGIAGPEDRVPWPYYTDRLDLELELGIVIGKAGANLSIEEAQDHIAGYTILVDSSCRDGYEREPFGPNKRKDFHTALGPCMVTADSIDPTHLACSISVDGEVWFTGSTDAPHSFTPAELVAYASDSEVVAPGDLIGTGTIGFGCSMDLHRWVKPGQQISFWIEKIGEMTLDISEPTPGAGHVHGMPGLLRPPATEHRSTVR